MFLIFTISKQVFKKTSNLFNVQKISQKSESIY